jgi:hypothetical protein
MKNRWVLPARRCSALSAFVLRFLTFTFMSSAPAIFDNFRIWKKLNGYK